MSIVTKIETGVPVPPPSKRTRAITSEYGKFFEVAEPGQSFVMDCPKNMVHDADLAKKWAQSAKSNPKSYAKKNGKLAETAEVRGPELPTGYGVRVWYIGPDPDAKTQDQ